jgi:putative endopeptidase
MSIAIWRPLTNTGPRGGLPSAVLGSGTRSEQTELDDFAAVAQDLVKSGFTWMSPETKRVALEKLAAFRPKIGYPDKWRDYSALEVRAGDAFGNSVRAAVVEWYRVVARINQPTDRDEWVCAGTS